MKTNEYTQRDAQAGKLSGLLIMVILCLITAISSAQTKSEDFTDYKPAPELISDQTSQNPSQEAAAPGYTQNHSADPTAKKERPVKREMKKELGYIGKVLISAVVSIILVKSLSATNGITIGN